MKGMLQVKGSFGAPALCLPFVCTIVMRVCWHREHVTAGQRSRDHVDDFLGDVAYLFYGQYNSPKNGHPNMTYFQDDIIPQCRRRTYSLWPDITRPQRVTSLRRWARPQTYSEEQSVACCDLVIDLSRWRTVYRRPRYFRSTLESHPSGWQAGMVIAFCLETDRIRISTWYCLLNLPATQTNRLQLVLNSAARDVTKLLHFITLLLFLNLSTGSR